MVVSIDRVRIGGYGHLLYRCRCGEHVSLPAHGQGVVTCTCGRRHSFDGEQITVVRADGEREG